MESFHGRGFVFSILVLCMQYGYHDKSEVMFYIDKFCDCCVLEHHRYLFKMNSWWFKTLNFKEKCSERIPSLSLSDIQLFQA